MTLHPAGRSKRIQSLSAAEICANKRLISPYSVNLSSPRMSLQHFAILLAASMSPISNNGLIVHNSPSLVMRLENDKPTPIKASWINAETRPCPTSIGWTCSKDKLSNASNKDHIQEPDLGLIAVAGFGLVATFGQSRRLRRMTLRQLGWRRQRIQISWRPPGMW
ncbi:MAG: hypothetical protein VKJ44_05000 [Synechococcus sp.]|nr:hypothetical protein [Synechococcus sp.]